MFTRAWSIIGPNVTAAELETAVPSLVSQAYGIVLEVGPGSGEQVSRIDPSKVTKVYGVEPVVSLHDALRAQVAKAGLNDKYVIVPCGIDNLEELKRYGIEPACADTVLSIKVLCSVPEPERIVRALYKVLKPGGSFILSEHVRSNNLVSRLVQECYNIVWPTMLGGCHLTRPTLEYLMKAGSWEKVEIIPYGEQPDFAVVPHVCGVLTKSN